MRLKGPEYAFYRTCSPSQRSDYERLSAELNKRFTPVRIPVVDTNMFHERKQRDKETVDEYAQELRRLFYKAYPRSQQSTKEAEEMGQNVLSCQFLAGLKQSIKQKLIGTEGTFDMLLSKARFEEVKGDSTFDKPVKPLRVNLGGDQTNVKKHLPSHNAPSKTECYACGLKGHIARNCRYKGRSAPAEARGRNPAPRQVATISTDETYMYKPGLKQNVEVTELEAALEGVLHHVTPNRVETDKRDSRLGPTLVATIMLEGCLLKHCYIRDHPCQLSL
jgi:hypothetical protein